MDPAAAPAAIRTARRPYTAALCVFSVLAVGLMVSGAWSLLSRLGVPVLELPWADVRTLTGAGVALERGLDPMVENPGDPWGRPFNYPRVWLLLPRLGLSAADSALLAWVMFAALCGGLWALRPLLTTRRGAWLLAAGALAPTTWLGLERANSDLLMFGLVAIATLLADAHRVAAVTAVGLAAVLKLYPIAGAVTLIGLRRGPTLRAMLPLGLAFATYVLWIRDDLRPMQQAAAHAPWLAYGLELVPCLVSKNTAVNATAALGAAAVMLLATAAFALLTRRHVRLGAAGSPASLRGFRAGAAVYLGTFLLGHSFDYRLLFLLLTVPQLAAWTRFGSRDTRRVAVVCVAAVLLLQWSLAWRSGLQALIGDTSPGVALDELLSWGAWAGLALLFAASLPDWLLPKSWRGAALLDATPRSPLAGPSPLPSAARKPRRSARTGA
ncbi:MAG: hypothetical protein R3F29_13170 [Planctomycetota bacterium]